MTDRLRRSFQLGLVEVRHVVELGYRGGGAFIMTCVAALTAGITGTVTSPAAAPWRAVTP
ncbi:hypothetical protein [Mycobacterium sp. SA01]|uniref:hypothetical protein n=1 Tax=Mycobacterium sp. SA01 TaxID=3238820 RepID=UPI00351BB2AE